nr:putative wall-associated receptor kinase-like 16 [Ipomoea batatas]
MFEFSVRYAYQKMEVKRNCRMVIDWVHLHDTCSNSRSTCQVKPPVSLLKVQDGDYRCAYIDECEKGKNKPAPKNATCENKPGGAIHAIVKEGYEEEWRRIQESKCFVSSERAVMN